MKKPLWTSLLWWTLFAAAFGYVEALVVVYIRRLTQMPPGLDYQQIWAVRHLAWNGPAIVGEMRRQGIYRDGIHSRDRDTALAAWPGLRRRTHSARTAGAFPVHLRRVGRDLLPLAEAVDGFSTVPGKHGRLFSGSDRLVRPGLVSRAARHARADCPRSVAAQAPFSFLRSLMSASIPGDNRSSAPAQEIKSAVKLGGDLGR